jgi:hypothetical protein
MPASSKRAKAKQKNVTKSRPNLRRSLTNPEDDHPAGLWVNVEFLRKLTKRDPVLLVDEGMGAVQNRYLELADIALQGRKKASPGHPPFRSGIEKKTE